MDRNNGYIPRVIESAEMPVRRSGHRRFDFPPRQALYYIHRVRNVGDRTAISFHVYGTDVARIGSSVRRYYDQQVLPKP